MQTGALMLQHVPDATGGKREVLLPLGWERTLAQSIWGEDGATVSKNTRVPR